MKKELGIDKFIKNLISKYLFEICMLAMIFAATAIRCRFASETTLSPDYESYYKPWVDFYRENGIIKGLGNAIGDYYVPLNVLYALCSLLPVEPWIPLSVVTYVCEMLSACSIFGIFYVLTGRKHHSMFAGVARKVKNVMVCRKCWIQDHYYEPMGYYMSQSKCCYKFCKCMDCFACCFDSCCSCCDNDHSCSNCCKKIFTLIKRMILKIIFVNLNLKLVKL